jgi:hypothetical protein
VTREERIEYHRKQLDNSYGDFLEAWREAGWNEQVEAHAAFVKGDAEDFGLAMMKAINKEFDLMAKSMADEEE